MLGQNSAFAAEGIGGSFIGTDFGVHQDLAPLLSEDFPAFGANCIPIYQAEHPDKTPSVR
jgi:hypothetical protein